MKSAPAEARGPTGRAPGGGAPPSSGRGLYGRLVGVAAAVVAADQATKQVALDRLSDGPVSVVPGVLTLRLTFNSGGAFGIAQGLPALFGIVTVAVCLGIVLYVRHVSDRRWLVPLGLVLGGGVGNLSDRLFRPFGGRVVDFVDLHVWPVFNLADSAITIGVILILVLGASAGARGAAAGPDRAGRPPA